MGFFKTLFVLDALDKQNDSANKLSKQKKELISQSSEIEDLKTRLQLAEKKRSTVRPLSIYQRALISEAEEEKEKALADLSWYEDLLSQPMLEIARGSSEFRRTYEKEQALLSELIIQKSAFKELVQKYGGELNKTEEELIQDIESSKERVVSGNSEFDNNVEPEVLEVIEKDKQNDIDKAEDDKQALAYVQKLMFKAGRNT